MRTWALTQGPAAINRVAAGEPFKEDQLSCSLAGRLLLLRFHRSDCQSLSISPGGWRRGSIRKALTEFSRRRPSEPRYLEPGLPE